MDNSAEGMATSGSSGRTPAVADLERLFKMSLDLLCIAGLDGYFKHVNPAFTRALGYREEDLLSKAFIEFVHPDDHESTLAAVGQLAEGLDVVDFENRYRAADGSWRWLAWRSTSVPDEGLIFAVARDITEHKQLQELAARQAEELARSNADLEQFASVASHDLQSPLRSVGNLADWIEEDLPADVPEKVSENLRTLRDRLEKMQHLVADLLLYARVGRDNEQAEHTDTAALVDAVAKLLGPPEGFEVVAAGDLPVFETTRTPLEQVFIQPFLAMIPQPCSRWLSQVITILIEFASWSRRRLRLPRLLGIGALGIGRAPSAQHLTAEGSILPNCLSRRAHVRISLRSR